MNRFGLWLTIGILFSMPVLVFAQDTGGCKAKVSSTGNKNFGKKATHERKVVGKKGASKAPKQTTEAKEPKTGTDTGKKQ
jgi:hypothetical protein